MADQQQYHVQTISRDVYESEYSSPLGAEDILAYVTDRPVEYVPYQGALIHIVGAKYPKKGYPTPEAIVALNIVKTAVKEATRYPLQLLSVNKDKLLTSFNNTFNKAFTPYKMKEEYLCPAAYGVFQFLRLFLIRANIQPAIANLAAFNFAHFIEYDDAYRYRMQDIMSESTHAQITENPRKEIKRLLAIFFERTQFKVGDTPAVKVARLLKPLMLLLFIPKYKRIFKECMTKDVFTRLQYDDADRYWASLKNEVYLFTGKTYEERTVGWEIPHPVKVEYNM